jgi:tetratricopeptide (TPR) repeat protein
VRSFAPAGHRHQAEVRQELGDFDLHASVTSVELVRGVLCTAHVLPTRPLAEKELWSLFREAYRDEPFVRLVKDKAGIHRYPEPKILAGTNWCDVGFEVDARTGRVVVLSAIDNLMKGAAGSAVQCMNLMCAFDAADDKEGMSWVLNNIGMLHTDIGSFGEARRSLARGLEIAQARGDLKMEGLCHLNTTEAFIGEGRWDDAAESCAEALRIATERGDPLRRADALKFRGVLARERGDLGGADRDHLDALASAREGQDTLLRAEILREVGETAHRRGDAQGAAANWEKAAGLFRSIDATLDAAQVEERLHTLRGSPPHGTEGLRALP